MYRVFWDTLYMYINCLARLIRHLKKNEYKNVFVSIATVREFSWVHPGPSNTISLTFWYTSSTESPVTMSKMENYSNVIDTQVNNVF